MITAPFGDIAPFIVPPVVLIEVAELVVTAGTYALAAVWQFAPSFGELNFVVPEAPTYAGPPPINLDEGEDNPICVAGI